MSVQFKRASDLVLAAFKDGCRLEREPNAVHTEPVAGNAEKSLGVEACVACKQRIDTAERRDSKLHKGVQFSST